MRYRRWRVLTMLVSSIPMTGCTANEHTAATGNDAASVSVPSAEARHDGAQTASTPAVVTPASSSQPAAPSAMPMQAQAPSAPPPAGGASPKTESQSTPASAPMMEPAQQPPQAEQPKRVTDLSDQVLATWGSSVCDGYSVPSGSGWPWTLATKLAQIKGPKVSHMSTPGQNTDSKESVLERSKVADANFVVVCLSLGNQGLGSTATEASAQALVDTYLDDIFTDRDKNDGDPESMVEYITSLHATPIVTLVYPMAEYNTMHCKHVVEANILQQSYGIATINHLGSTNAGNNFDQNDCLWANGLNAPINVQSDARHPTKLGHDEMFYAFPPDLPFALASGIAFPTRPPAADSFFTLAAGQPNDEPVRYTPEHATHNYTLQFGFLASSDGTLAAISLGMNGFITLEVKGGLVHLIADGGKDALQDAQTVTDAAWHDVAVTYSYVRQKLSLYVDGKLSGEHDARDGTSVRELFPQSFVLGAAAGSGRPAAPSGLQLKDLFVNRSALHAREIEERATTDWVGSGSLDIYAPLRATNTTENRAQTLQTIAIHN